VPAAGAEASDGEGGVVGALEEAVGLGGVAEHLAEEVAVCIQ
jgi:hypothetical protein